MEARAQISGAENKVLSGVLYIGHHAGFCNELVKARSHMRVVERDVLSGLPSISGGYVQTEVVDYNVLLYLHT